MRIDIEKEALNRKITLDKQAKHLNWLGVMFGALLYMVQRPRHYENWSGII